MKWLFTLLLIINLVIYLVWIRGEDPLTVQPRSEIKLPEADMGQIRLLSEIPPQTGEEATEAQSEEEVGDTAEMEAPDVAMEMPAEESPESGLESEVMPQEADEPQSEPGPGEEAQEITATEETEAQAVAHPFAAEPETPLVDTVDRCGALGGIADEKSANETLSEMEAEGVTASAGEVSEKIQIGYWVLIPPLESAQEAQRKLEELRGNGILDIWHIRGGEAENAISLGMFSREENARKYRDKMAAQGVEAEIRPRHINKRGYRIEFRVSGKPAVVEEYWSSLELRFPGLKLAESACNLIATEE